METNTIITTYLTIGFIYAISIIVYAKKLKVECDCPQLFVMMLFLYPLVIMFLDKNSIKSKKMLYLFKFSMVGLLALYGALRYLGVIHA